MIQNIVFDMGGVLVRYDVEHFCALSSNDPEERRLLRENMFTRPEWVMMDRGKLSPEDACVKFRALLPERLHPMVERFVYHWIDDCPHIPGMEALLRTLKEKGYGLYILSNAAATFPTVAPKLPATELFDAKFVSCDWQLVKPQPEIYRTFCLRYGLAPASCFFIDDMSVNVEGAIYSGMQGYVFHGDAGRLREALRAAGVDC